MATDKVMIEFGVETAGLKSELDKVKSGLTDVEKTAKKTTAAVKSGFGDAKDALGELSPAMGQAVKGVEGLGAAFKTLLANPIFLALAGLVATLAALYKAFTYTDEGANKVKGAFAAVGAAVDVLKQNMATLAKGLYHIFTLQWGKAIDDFKGIGNAMKEAGAAAYQYTQELDRLADAETAHATVAAKNALKISELEFAAADRSKSLAERKNSLKEAIKLGEEEVAWQVAHAKDTFEVEVTNVAGRLKVSKESIRQLLAAKDGERDGLIKSNAEIKKITEADGGEFEITLQKKAAAILQQQQVFSDTQKRNFGRMTAFNEGEYALDLANQQKANAKKEAEQKKYNDTQLKLQQQYLAEVKQIKDKELSINADYDNALKQQDVNNTKDLLTHKLAELEAAAEKEINAANEKNKKIQEDNDLTEESKKKSAFTTAQAIEKINHDLAIRQGELIKADVDATAKAQEEITKKTKEEADKRLELEKQAKMAALDTLTKASDAYFQMQANARAQEGNDIQQKYNDESAALENMKAKGMIAEGAYAAKKKALDDKYKADEKAFKIKSFEADKQAALTKIAIDTALAVVKTFVSYGGFTPAAWIAVAAQVAAGGIQAAVVESQPVPAFAKGTKKAPAGLKWVGEEGPELINDKGGYAIITNKESMAIMDKYNIPTRPSFANNVLNNLGVYNQLTYPDYASIDIAIARKAEANHQRAFNMAISAVMQGTDNREDLMRLNKTIKANKGVVIENIEQLADAIKPKDKRSLWN